MPKAHIHPHPIDPEIARCKNCFYWHPAYVKDMAINPQTGQGIAVADLVKQGRGAETANLLTDKMSTCFKNPKWEMTGENSYCGYFTHKDIFKRPAKFEIVEAPGDLCGNTKKLPDGSPCPGCRACL